MKRAEFDRMSTDDLWSLHVEVTQLLQQKSNKKNCDWKSAWSCCKLQ